MAGGFGTRLQPLTFSLPKSLLPVGDKPIIEIILRKLRRHGFQRVFVSVGHKGHLIRAFITQLELEGLDIVFVAEDEPLGTAGPLRLLPAEVDELFLINGDILTDLDFAEVTHGHRRARRRVHDGGRAPSSRHAPLRRPHDRRRPGDRDRREADDPLAGRDRDVRRRRARTCRRLPPGRFDMPDLIRMLARDGHVRAHMLEGHWTDVADLADYEKVNLEGTRWADT